MEHNGPAQPADEAATAGGALTDANIVALLDEANQADSAAGAYALTKATDPEAKKLNVTPQPPPDDPVQPLAKSEMTALRAAPKGPEFDRTYIDQEVAVHKAVRDLVNKAHDQARNEELKALIEQAKPVIEKHLAKAEEIQKKLGGPTA